MTASLAISLAPVGSAAPARAAVRWVHDTALRTLDLALGDIEEARTRADRQWVGASGSAYAAHVGELLRHGVGLRERLLRAVALFDAYAHRLAAHEALLEDLARRAAAAGLDVVGTQVYPPIDATDPRAARAWAHIGAVAGDERDQLMAWVRTHLDSAVDSFVDEELARWVLAFVEGYDSTLVAAGSTGVLTRAGQVGTELGERLARFGRVPGPAALAYDTVRALSGEEPAEGLWKVGVGFAASTVAVATLPVTAPVAGVAAVSVAATVAGALVAEKAWNRLPEEATDILDEAAAEAVDDVTDWAGERMDQFRGWLRD